MMRPDTLGSRKGNSVSNSDIFSALSIVVSGLAALLAGIYARRTLRFSEAAEVAASAANQHSENSNILSANTWLDQYLINVRQWADEGCECISRALHAQRLNETERAQELFEALYRLSSLVDRGRWFFPNQWNDEIGTNKEPAYRGLRQPILDHLVNAYNAIEDSLNAKNGDMTSEILHHQRLFVSEVQTVLNPRRRAEEIARIDEQFAISQRITEQADTPRLPEFTK